DVQRWRAEPSAYILMVQDPVTRRGLDQNTLQRQYPRTLAYLQRFESVLRKRSSRGVSDMLKKGAPFYTMFGVGEYTFAPWKVVWTRLAQIQAAVAGHQNNRPVVPQETVTLVECRAKSEAHYLAALVNSSPFQFAAISYSQEGGKSMGSMHLLEHIRIPRYNAKNPTHRRLAKLSVKAHRAAQVGDEKRLRKIEAQINQQAARLLGLTSAELAEIEQSLRESEG
ncbi:MAG: hypothetical protein NZM42_02925, partial [Gemmatales bacterium]|nr:hypothetical protein [Gemmatales bacterium]